MKSDAIKYNHNENLQDNMVVILLVLVTVITREIHYFYQYKK